jgi:GMP synthase (glutamine-hydrolysing)
MALSLAALYHVEFAAHKIEGETTYAIHYHPEVSSPMDGSMQRTQVKIRSVAKFYVNQKLCA